jgi:hypothetical protein
MSTPTRTLIPILAGNVCIGHLIERGRAGFEAFDRDDSSLGVFPTAAQAVDALLAVASTPPEDAA